MTPFCFEHVFRAPSVDAVLAAYFDPDHQVEQDRAIEITRREVLEHDDGAAEVRRVCRVVPRRQLPALVKPFVAGPLHYVEQVTWRRQDSVIDFEIRPSLLNGRAQVLGTYRLEPLGPGEVRRIYAGDVSVDLAWLGSRIERGIVAELGKTLPVAAACTQSWLDRQATTFRDSSGLNPGNSSGIISG